MIPLLLFDMQIWGAAILTLLFFLHLAYGKHKQVLHVLQRLPPSLPRVAQPQRMGRGPQEEQALLPAMGTQLPA